MIGSRIPQYMDDLRRNWPNLAPKYTRSESLKDVLFRADYQHVEHPNTDEGQKEPDSEEEEDEEEEEEDSCIHCDQTKTVRRKPRDMRVHYGLIASGNQVIKDARFRDEVNQELGGKVLCFEMEAAGLMNDFPCLVIRGICDYADSHKNKMWQEHAAAVAAAYAKELLMTIAVQEVEQMPTVIKQLKDQIKGISDAIDEIRSDQREHRRDEEYKTILEWLTPMNYATQQSYFMTQKQEGTNEWILNSDEFQHWLKHTSQTLFCPGIPGAGKTIITATVIDHLHENFRDDSSVGIAYLYCTFKQQKEQSALDLITNVLKQLAMGQPILPQSLKDLYKRHKLRRTRPLLSEIRETFHQVAKNYAKTFILIDALDECQNTQGNLSKLIQEVFEFQADVKANIFATSRLIQEIESKFDKAIRLEIRAHGPDVEMYLRGQLGNCQFLSSQSDSLRRNIQHVIAKAVDGMFLLARLYLDSIACKTTTKAIKQTLAELETASETASDDKRAKALDNAYEQAVQRIQSQLPEHRELAMRVLSWITCTERQLTLAELLHALGTEENTSELDQDAIPNLDLVVSTCTGLVTVDKESDIIRLIHHTTHEYFQRTWERWFPNAQIDITIACVTYLSFEVFNAGACSTEELLEERFLYCAFFAYASRYWGNHARKSVTGENVIMGLLEHTDRVSACSQALLYQETYLKNMIEPTQMTNLHLVAYFGLSGAAFILLGKRKNIDCDEIDRGPLWIAAYHGHNAVVKLLLEKNANIETKNMFDYTPLSYAASNGHEAVVRLLLENNANIETKSRWENTPLSYAAFHGHEAVVKLLLQNNANIETKNRWERTPLSYAAFHGHEAVVKLLLQNNANIEAMDESGQTPISDAALNGHEAVVKLLLENNANIETMNELGETPLSNAALNGHEAVVKLLLENNANVETRNELGRTPLSYASSMGHEKVVRLLLEK
ncbi:hypothetical protein N7467_008450 [Penicillium canescens]|nr:hypothetical protein N7467_008450 [Penicillium canescens]